MIDLQAFSEYLKVFLQVANVIVLGYALYRFLNKPHNSLESKHEELKKRVDEHDLKFKEVEQSLHQGNDQFREQKDINRMFMNCMLSFIDFERGYCAHTGYEDTDDLEEARSELKKYLATSSK